MDNWTVGALVRDSVRHSLGNSVLDSMENPVWNSIER